MNSLITKADVFVNALSSLFPEIYHDEECFKRNSLYLYVMKTEKSLPKKLYKCLE